MPSSQANNRTFPWTADQSHSNQRVAFCKERSAAWTVLLPGPDPIKSRSLLFVFGSALDKENKNQAVRTEKRYSKAIKVELTVLSLYPPSQEVSWAVSFYWLVWQLTLIGKMCRAFGVCWEQPLAPWCDLGSGRALWSQSAMQGRSSMTGNGVNISA